MKKINLIVIILGSLLALYLLYRMIRESWTKSDDILLLILLAVGTINSGLIEHQRKKQNKKISDDSQT